MDRNRTALVFAALLLLGALALGILVAKSDAQVPTKTLLWTVPQGVLSGATYEMRLSRSPIAGVDTLSWWNAAGIVSGLPVPGVIGATDSVVVAPQAFSQAYYVVIRTCNVGPACSFFSNVHSFTTPAPPPSPPFRITDLRSR